MKHLAETVNCLNFIRVYMEWYTEYYESLNTFRYNFCRNVLEFTTIYLLCIAELFRLYSYQEIYVYIYIDNLSITQNYSHFMLYTNYVIIFHFCFTCRLSQVHKLLLLFFGALYVWAWRKWRCSLLAWATFLYFLFLSVTFSAKKQP